MNDWTTVRPKDLCCLELIWINHGHWVSQVAPVVRNPSAMQEMWV